MAVVVPSSYLAPEGGGLAAVAPQPVRASNVQRIVESSNRTYATRVRCLMSTGYTVQTTQATFFDLITDCAVRTSGGSAATSYTVQIMGSQIEARVTVSDGVASASATVTQSGASTATATGTISTAPPVAGASDLFVTVEIRATSGTGTLLGLALVETDLTASEI